MSFEEEWDEGYCLWYPAVGDIERNENGLDMIVTIPGENFILRVWEYNQGGQFHTGAIRREMMQIYRYLNKQDVLITRIFDGGREF